MSGCVLLAATRSPDLGQREGKRKRETSSLRAAAAVLHLPGSSCLSGGFHTLVFDGLCGLRGGTQLTTYCAAPDICVTHNTADALPSPTLSFCSHSTAIFCWGDLQGSLGPVTFKMSYWPVEN